MRTYAHIYDGLVVELFSTDGDITTMFHPSLIWVEVTDSPSVIPGWVGSQVEGVWVFGPYVPPPPTYEELLYAATANRDSLLRFANDQLIIQPLQFKKDLDVATEDEEVLLLSWKQYCVDLSNAQNQEGWPGSVVWPSAPGA